MAGIRAPELEGRGGWIGAGSGLGLAALAGKVVVLHFWTSSCINCVRVLEELRPIEDRFAGEAVVIGVHSPKFPREHEHGAVQRAVERLGIRHAVLDDPDLATWQQYAIKGWPTVVIVDPGGYVVGAVPGEGCGPVVEAAVARVVAEHDAKGTLSRGPVPALTGPGVPAVRPLAFPGKVVVSPDGRRLAIADTGNGRVLVCDLQGRVEQVYPLLTNPQGVLFDGDRLVVCDAGSDRVVAIDRATGQQTVLADGIASPWDVALLDAGVLLVAEAGRHRLWRIGPAGDPVVAAGTGQENLADGHDALLAQPSGIAVLTGGDAVFVDAESSALRMLAADGTVSTLVGQGVWDWGASDGGADTAALQHPLGVAAGGGSVFVADTLNCRLREWRDGTLRTLPAEGLDEPGGLDVLPDGRLVVADTNNHRVVVVDGADVQAIVVDESWLGTAVGEPAAVTVGDDIPITVAVDTGSFSLDPSAGPPVRVDVSADPPALLAPGPRRWALDGPGRVSVLAGRPGDGILVVEIETAVCDDEQCTVLRTRTRRDLSVAAPLRAAARA